MKPLRFLTACVVGILTIGMALIPARAQNPRPSPPSLAPVDVGPTGIAIKRPVFAGADSNPYVEPPPDAVPDISATSEINLINAWNGEAAYANDHKQRRNYRIVAMVQQPNFLLLAAAKKSGINDLSQIKDRPQPTWIALPRTISSSI